MRRFVLFFVVVAVATGGCVYSRMLYYNIPTLSSPRLFTSRQIRASPSPDRLPPSREEAPFRLTIPELKNYRSFDDLLERNETRAFVAIRDDRIVYERYFHGVTAETALADFSISKTVAALLVGCAIADGLIDSVDRSLVSYVPELAGRSGYDAITIDQLLRMTSGIDFDEDSFAGAALFYSTDLLRQIYSYHVKWKPGTHYLYGSVSTEILWDVLHRQLAGRTVSAYFEQRIWLPLGAEHAASWAIDDSASGVEKLFGGFSATARDHARLGLLFLHRGAWAGRQIIPEDWVTRSLTADPIAGRYYTVDGWVGRGRYQWFLTPDGRAYFAKGYRGQYIFVVPAKHMVFVRFGEGYGDVDWRALFLRLSKIG